MSEKQIIIAGNVKKPRGWVYWVTVGWMWEPFKWMGRVTLWLFILPLGIWRSWVAHRNRQARGSMKQLTKELKKD